jgi:outer membrane protein TolC
MLKKIFIGLVVIQAIISAKTVSFDEAVRLAVRDNQELKAKKLDIEHAKQDLEEAKSYKLGKLEFNENVTNTNHAGYVFGMKMAQRRASFADFGFDQFLSQMGSLQSDPTGSKILGTQPDKLNHPQMVTNFETKVVYEVPLYTGGKLDSAKEMASLQILANKAKYARDEKVLGLEVLKAYNGAVTAKAFIKITEDSKKIALNFIRKSQALYNEGLVHSFEVKQAQSAYKNIDIKLQEARTKFKLAIAYLQFLTNDNTISDVGQMKGFVFHDRSLIGAKQSAVAKRDDYVSMNYNVKTMKEKITFDSATMLPTVGAHLEFGFNDNQLLTGANRDYYMAAVGLQYTLFDGGLRSIKKEKALLDYQKVKNYEEYMKQGIALEVQQHYENLQIENKTLEDKIELSNASKGILKEIENVYDNNLKFRTSMMYLLMQLGNLVQAEADVAMSKYNKSIAEANLKIAMGESLEK